MESRQKFGLIGTNISYSFSKKYFENKFQQQNLRACSYDIYDLKDISELVTILKIKNLCGINVTIPFKEKIIPYLDELSNEAANIGAVNTVAFRQGKKIGFNTDAFGFEKTLLKILGPYLPKALILGNGGAAKAVKYVLEKHQISYQIVSRKTAVTFENLTKKTVYDHELIIQCTPVGTFPNTNDCIQFPFDALTPKHLIIDLIYNPAETSFMKKSAMHGAKSINGLYMLEQQAEKAWDIWNFEEK